MIGWWCSSKGKFLELYNPRNIISKSWMYWAYRIVYEFIKLQDCGTAWASMHAIQRNIICFRVWLRCQTFIEIIEDVFHSFY